MFISIRIKEMRTETSVKPVEKQVPLEKTSMRFKVGKDGGDLRTRYS